VPRAVDLDPELRGPRLLAGLQPGNAILPEEPVAALCEELTLSFGAG
jgi:hypothetical protein